MTRVLKDYQMKQYVYSGTYSACRLIDAFPTSLKNTHNDNGQSTLIKPNLISIVNWKPSSWKPFHFGLEMQRLF